MKKLMITAAAVAMTAGAFAAPLVYDYKASAKHMYAKEISVKYNDGTFKIYQKYVKSASLKGYLIVDADGATSKSIVNDKVTNDPQVIADGYGNAVPATTAADFGRNRAFLVVQNSKAESQVRFPKLIPAVLDAKWFDTKYKTDNGEFGVGSNPVRAKTGLAEGYLYAGGDFAAVGNVRPNLERFYDTTAADGTYIPDEAIPVNPNVSMICDYAWQSLWLFGSKNMPLIANLAIAGGFWDAAQAAIEAKLVLPNGFAGNQPWFHDSWMNGAGFGKYVVAGGDYEYCCGYSDSDEAVVLQSLSGNLKGGLFICTENGTNLAGGNYNKPTGYAWEDQFFCARMVPGTTWAADRDQTDLWQDGELELNTTDCISGTWSIKLTARDLRVSVTNKQLEDLGVVDGDTKPGYLEDAPGLSDLIDTINGAALRLNSGTIFTNGREINQYKAKELASYAQVPLMTPSFAAYYGFLNFK